MTLNLLTFINFNLNLIHSAAATFLIRGSQTDSRVLFSILEIVWRHHHALSHFHNNTTIVIFLCFAGKCRIITCLHRQSKTHDPVFSEHCPMWHWIWSQDFYNTMRRAINCELFIIWLSTHWTQSELWRPTARNNLFDLNVAPSRISVCCCLCYKWLV